MSDIVKNIELMCDNSPNDKKIILLAKLVEDRFESVMDGQKEIAKRLDDTTILLKDTLKLLENVRTEQKNCPVYRNTSDFERVSFFVQHPKITVATLLGVMLLAVEYAKPHIQILIKSLWQN